MTRTKLLMLGLDGATLDVIEPLAVAGRLPNLARWMRDGGAARLASTVPPVSFPAWSSLATGLDPGEHGLLDFTQKLPGAYRLRFVNASDRCGETLFGSVTRAGGRVLSLGMPATWPPERVDGLLVAGFDAPVSTGTDARSASDPALYAAIAARTGPWMAPDLDESAGGDAWGAAAVDQLVRRVRRKTDFALEALRTLRASDRGRAPDLVSIVFSESDTVAHHFWRDWDPASPRRDPHAPAARRDAVPRVYEALDAACGELCAAVGDEALCLVVSDHGAGGASRHVAHLNRRLAECGLLARRKGSGRGLARTARDVTARSARDLLLRALPPAWVQRAFRLAGGRAAAARVESAARFGGFDWRRTSAFSEEANTQPGVWINLRGRESEGCVAPADYERVRTEAIGALLDWKLPDGGPVVARARRREDVYTGSCVERAPDVVVELALDEGYGLSLVPTPWGAPDARAIRRLADDELAGGRGRGMNGTHRPDGVCLEVGPAGLLALAHGERPPGLTDVAPAVLRALGVSAAPRSGPPPRANVPYSAADEALVSERLRALGYLE